MYAGYLDSVYKLVPDINHLSYDEHLRLLFRDSTDFTGSYIKNLKKLGFEASAVIANDHVLQKKWMIENGFSNDNLLTEQVIQYNPDILWIDNLGLVDEKWIRKIKENTGNIKLVIGYHCSPVNAKVLDSVKAVDLMITCTPGLKSYFEASGKKTYLIYHAFDPDSLSLINNTSTENHDLIFSGSLTTGTSFHGDRLSLIEQIIDSGIDIGLYVNLESRLRIASKKTIFAINSVLSYTGFSALTKRIRILQHGRSGVNYYSGNLLKKTKNPVYGAAMFNLLHNSRITLNYHIGVAGEYAGNMRMFEATGIGSCLLTDNKKNVNDLFIPGKEVMVYDNPGDCIEKIKWLLDHEDERKKIAAAGQRRTLRCHTTMDRCKMVADIINSEMSLAK